MKNVIIIGGGSAGWMTASTLVKQFPELNVTLVESPNIPIAGVGESTIAGINEWMNLIGVEDKDFMKATDATYKLSIKFNNFYKKGEGFHYPFSYPYTADTTLGVNDWHIKKMVYPETPNSDYADSFYSIMALVNQNKFDKNLDDKIPYYKYGQSTAYHFDATKFGLWLRDNICLPAGLKHITSEVKHVKTDEVKGIHSIELENGLVIMGDLFIDCTGFRSLLMDKTLKVPFESFEYMLPNNRAWATRIPYTNKEEEMVPYTDSTALGNGWVWRIPLWSRMGTGYVYSDKHVTPEEALEEFKDHLKSLGTDTTNLEYKDLKMRVGIHERTWHKNCVAIGLSAGFIEPLESNGLYTVHKFLVELCRTLLRCRDGLDKTISVSQYDKTIYNTTTKKLFKEFATFVAMHYALTRRRDTKYWNDCFNREYDPNPLDENISQVYGFKNFGIDKMIAREFHLSGGFPCIASGMGYNAIDEVVQKTGTLFTGPGSESLSWETCKKIADKLSRNPQRWEEATKRCLSHYEYLRTTIYRDDSDA
jgi:flavin-dependent dehydrogenase